MIGNANSCSRSFLSIDPIDDERRNSSLMEPVFADGVWRRAADTGRMIYIKRTYDPPARSDGMRFLVERLWPRGMKKEALEMDAWLKDVAPSAKLRQWFGHRPERWAEFRRRYREELTANPHAWAPILEASRGGATTLLYSARDVAHNGAVVLRDFVTARQRRRTSPRALRTQRRQLSKHANQESP